VPWFELASIVGFCVQLLKGLALECFLLLEDISCFVLWVFLFSCSINNPLQPMTLFIFYSKLKYHHTTSALYLHSQTPFNISFQAHYTNIFLCSFYKLFIWAPNISFEWFYFSFDFFVQFIYNMYIFLISFPSSLNQKIQSFKFMGLKKNRD
jgi:hypothetical protein